MTPPDAAPRAAFTIVHRDELVVAVSKPAGMLVHRSAIDAGERDVALQRLRDMLGRPVFPVHRLDRPTSGILLFALSADVARQLASRFASRSVDKCYLAVVRGWTAESGTIDHPLREERDTATDARACSGKDAQPAVTRFRRLATAELAIAVRPHPTARYALVELRPVTGRRHQIRRHLKHVFHPIVGDTTHGDGRHNALFRERFGCARLMLHAYSLALAHPATGEMLRLVAPLHGDFGTVAARLGWREVLDRYARAETAGPAGK